MTGRSITGSLLLALSLTAWPALPVPAQLQDAPDTSWAAAPDSGAAAPADYQGQVAELNARLLADPADGKAWNDLGVLYAGHDELDLARDCFIRAVQTAPREADYHRNLGVAFSRLGDFEIAAAEFEAYRRFDTLGSLDYWRLIGEAQLRAGQLEAARATFNEGIAALGPDQDPERMRLVLNLWKVAADQGDEQAERDLLEAHTGTAVDFLRREDRRDQDGWREAQAILDNRVSMLVEDGKLYEQSGLPVEAARMYKEAYTLAPDRLDLLPRLVDAYLKEGLEFEARTAVRLAQERFPDQAGTWLATAKVHEQAGQLEEAVKAYQEAFAIDSSIEDLRLAIGNLLMRLGRDAEASEFLRGGVNTAEAKPEVVYNYAVSLMRDGKFNAAIPSLRSVVKELPQMQQAWVALAQCLQTTGQHAAAVEAFEQAHALQPDPKVIFQAASSAQKAGLHERAIADYQAALQQDPAYAKALYNLALVFMDAGRYPEAAAAFDQLIQLEGATYRAYYSQGLSYFYMEDTARALEAFELAMALQETPEVLNNIGLVYDKMGDKKEAQIWYRLAKDFKGGS